MAAKPAPKDKAPAPAGGGGGKRWLVPALIAVVLAAVAGGGIAFFMSRSAEPATPSAEVPVDPARPAAPTGKPEYIALDPPFVVNLADDSGDRYLQVEVQLMSRQAKIGEDLTLHMPVIRNRLLMLFSQQTTEGLRTREAKEKLQADALAEVKNVLKEATGSDGIEALYFTSFVTQ